MDKLDWPFAMLLPQAASPTLYELANNHVWRTEFAFRTWNCPAAPYLQPPYGGRAGGEREWVHYTLGMYYTLLNCGLAVVPTAGTANGVHPVPVGFSRVYVHLPDGFTYEKWVAVLKAGRSFVTTGPMLFAMANGKDPGETFRQDTGPVRLRIAGTVRSEQPLAFIEVVRDGLPALTFMPRNLKTTEGAFETAFEGELSCDVSGWVGVRCWEDRPGGRFRFAHSGPWQVRIAGKPARPRSEEKTYLIGRMNDEMAPARASCRQRHSPSINRPWRHTSDSKSATIRPRSPKTPGRPQAPRSFATGWRTWSFTIASPPRRSAPPRA